MKIKYDLNEFVKCNTIESVRRDLVEREKSLRKSKKISQRDLSNRSNVTYASIRRFETTGEISLTALIKIANALDALDDFNKVFAERLPQRLKDIDL